MVMPRVIFTPMAAILLSPTHTPVWSRVTITFDRQLSQGSDEHVLELRKY